jgi:hypothetical protein
MANNDRELSDDELHTNLRNATPGSVQSQRWKSEIERRQRLRQEDSDRKREARENRNTFWFMVGGMGAVVAAICSALGLIGRIHS